MAIRPGKGSKPKKPGFSVDFSSLVCLGVVVCVGEQGKVARGAALSGKAPHAISPPNIRPSQDYFVYRSGTLSRISKPADASHSNSSSNSHQPSIPPADARQRLTRMIRSELVPRTCWCGMRVFSWIDPADRALCPTEGWVRGGWPLSDPKLLKAIPTHGASNAD